MSTPIETIIKCPYCGTEHNREASCLGRHGETVFHRCRACHGDFSFDIDPDVAEGDEYWEADRSHPAASDERTYSEYWQIFDDEQSGIDEYDLKCDQPEVSSATLAPLHVEGVRSTDYPTGPEQWVLFWYEIDD